jgi:single-strand DNA-binding protein
MYQQWTALGNLGSEVELRYTTSGVAVATFSLAVNRSWTDADGNKKDKTLWARVTAWRKLGETAAEYLTKGRQVLVVGEIEEVRPFTDKSGNNRASLEITANTIRFVGSKGGATDPTDSVSVDDSDEMPPF